MADDLLALDANTGVAACYNSEDGFKSMGTVIATGENSFTYILDDDDEVENSWEEDFEAI